MLFASGAASAQRGQQDVILQPFPTPSDENSHISYYETTYTFQSDFEESKLGHGDSIYNDFAYDHRFLIKGNWYFRAASNTNAMILAGEDNGLPDHWQALYGHLALEYDGRTPPESASRPI